jgi:hypothetical protein
MVLRMIFFLVGIVLGMALGWGAFEGRTDMLLIGGGIGAGVGALILAAEQRLKKVPLPLALWGGGGLVAGLLIAGWTASPSG